ncbi:MerR family transcriptional regulator [Peptoniphilaceae bacterium SGI.131]
MCKEYNIDGKDRLYSIGEASDHGNVSRRTLRYYEKLGLIKPDFVEQNGYRYYSLKTIMKIPIIKYLKMMNFSLDQINLQLGDIDYYEKIQSFNEQILECDKNIREIEARKQVITDWKVAIEESCMAMNLKTYNISIKYKENIELIKYPILFDYDYRKAILDVNFAKFVEDNKNLITGTIMMVYDSYKNRFINQAENKVIPAVYVQKTTYPILNKDIVFVFRKGFYACGYHFGCHDTIKETYDRIEAWAKEHGRELEDFAVERFVTDHWSSNDENQFVTEVLIKIKES